MEEVQIYTELITLWSGRYPADDMIRPVHFMASKSDASNDLDLDQFFRLLRRSGNIG